MDPATHALAGALIPQAGFRRKGSFWVSIISSVAPDFDYVTIFWGFDTFLRHHRGVTHGVLALFLFPLVMGSLARYRMKKGFFYYALLSFLAYGIHLFMDLIDSYGVRIFSPLDWNVYSLNIVFILDPYITVGLVLSLAACYIHKKQRVAIVMISLVVFLSYAGGRYYGKNQSERLLRNKLDEYIYSLSPLPHDFLRWWFVTRSGESIKVGFVDLFTQRVYLQDSYTYSEAEKEIILSRETDTVKAFLSFARFPYPEVKKNKTGTIVTWKELTYAFLPGERFAAKAAYGKDGRLSHAYFRF